MIMNYHILLVLLLASLLAPTCAVFQRRIRAAVARKPKRFLTQPRDYHVPLRGGPASPGRLGSGATTVSPGQGGEELDAYIGDVISFLQKREELPADHPVWEGVRSDFLHFHASDEAEDRSLGGGKMIRSTDDDAKMIHDDEELREMPVDPHNPLSGITSDGVKGLALQDEEKEDYAGYHDCSIHFLEYDESVMVMKVFFHTPLCIEREEDKLRGALPDAEVSRVGTENSVMLAFAYRKDYDMAYQVYREEVRVNDGLEVDLTGISGWNPGGGKAPDGFSHVNVVDDAGHGQSYDEIVDFLELYDDRNEPDASREEDEEKEEEEEELEESNFEEYVRKVVMKLHAREHIPVRDPVWQGVRRDFADFLYGGEDTDGYRRVAGRHVSYDGGEARRGPSKEEVKQEDGQSSSSYNSAVNFVAQGVLGVCFVVLVSLVIKYQRERRPRKNVVLPVTTGDVPQLTSAPIGCRVLDPELHRISLGIDGCPRPESAAPRYIVVAPTEPRPPSRCYKLQV